MLFSARHCLTTSLFLVVSTLVISPDDMAFAAAETTKISLLLICFCSLTLMLLLMLLLLLMHHMSGLQHVSISSTVGPSCCRASRGASIRNCQEPAFPPVL